MRIGILSDTHDQLARTVQAVHLLVVEGAEALVHCGDLTVPSIVDACARLPMYFVFGNNDYDEHGLRHAAARTGAVCLGWGDEVRLAGKRLAVTHGDSWREVRRLAGLEPDYLLYGHSHVAEDRREGPTRWINPGALHRASAWTVALLDLDLDRLALLTV